MSFPAPRPAPKKRFIWWLYLLLLAIILVVALAPVASVIHAGSVANAHGCQLDEGSAHPCIVDGRDIGGELYTFGVMGWLMLATLPIGVVALLIWAIVLITHRISWGQARRKAQRNGQSS